MKRRRQKPGHALFAGGLALGLSANAPVRAEEPRIGFIAFPPCKYCE